MVAFSLEVDQVLIQLNYSDFAVAQRINQFTCMKMWDGLMSDNELNRTRPTYPDGIALKIPDGRHGFPLRKDGSNIITL
jgi:hypothetical protein